MPNGEHHSHRMPKANRRWVEGGPIASGRSALLLRVNNFSTPGCGWRIHSRDRPARCGLLSAHIHVLIIGPPEKTQRFQSPLPAIADRFDATRKTFQVGRVRNGRGSLGPMAITPFPIPAHRTGRTDFRYPALRLAHC